MVDYAKETADYLLKIDGFASGTRKQCPQCDCPVTGVTLYEKTDVDYSLYIEPCGHRMGLWPAAPDWIEADGLPVEIIEHGK